MGGLPGYHSYGTPLARLTQLFHFAPWIAFVSSDNVYFVEFYLPRELHRPLFCRYLFSQLRRHVLHSVFVQI